MKRFLPVAACLLVASPAGRAVTADNWTGGSSTNFEDGANWSLGLPANDQTTHLATFAGTPTARQPSLTASRNLAGLAFSTAAGGWTLGIASPSLVLSNGASGITSAGQTSGTNLIRANFALGASQTWQAGTGGNLLFTGSVLSGTNTPQNPNPTLGIPAWTINSAANKGAVILSPAVGQGVSMIGSNAVSLINVKAGGWLALGGDGTNSPATTSTNHLQNTSTGGFGTWGINSPGVVRVNSGTWFTGDLGKNGGDNFTGLIEVNGGSLSLAGARYLNNGTINVSGGTLCVANSGSTIVNGGRFSLGAAGTTGAAALNLSGGLVDLAQANSGNSIGSAISTLFTQTGGTFQNGVTPGGGVNGGAVATFTIGATGTAANNNSAVTLAGGTFISAGAVQGGVSTGTGNRNNFNFNGGTLSVGAFDARNLGYASATGLAGGPPHANPVANSVGLGALYNNGGTLAPGGTNTPGLTSITGDYVVNSPAAVLTVDLGGNSPAGIFQDSAGHYDTVTVSGSVVLGGSLQVSLINGYLPAHGDTFTILSGVGLSGAFTNVAWGSRLRTTGGEGSFLVFTNGFGGLTLSLFATNGQPPTVADAIVQLQIEVNALPATNAAQQLKNAVLNLALEQASNGCAVGYLADASNRIADVQGTLGADASVMAAMNSAAKISSLVPPIVTNGNPYLDVMNAGLAAALASPDAAFGKNTTNVQVVASNARDVGEEMEALLFQFANPACTNRGNAEVLTRFLRRAHAYADTVDVWDAAYAAGASFYDDFAMAPFSCALREFAWLYPGLLLPSQQALWDRAMNKASAKMWIKVTTDASRGRYANIDLLEAHQFLNFGLYFTNQTYLDKSRWLVDQRTNDAYADGAWAYIWTQNESRGYHSVDTDYLARYWLVSGYPLCTNLLAGSQWYGPVSNPRLGEFWTAPSWKQLWNSAQPDTGGEQAIAFSGNPYLRWLRDTYYLPDALVSPADWGSRRWDATFYRNDLSATAPPTNFTLLDRNLVGPRAQLGRFSYAATGRRISDTEPGHYTLMGAGIGQTNGSLWDALVLGFIRGCEST